MKFKAHAIISVMTYVLAILCIAAGAPKILRMPQELEFLSSIGLSSAGVLILGVLQLTGGILLFKKKSRLPGAAVACFTLLVSSVAIFVGGNTLFGLISLLPVVVSLIIIGSVLNRAERADA